MEVYQEWVDRPECKCYVWVDYVLGRGVVLMLDKIKNLPLTLILAIAFLSGMLVVLCVTVPAVGFALVTVAGIALSVARILYFFLNGR